MLLVDDEQAALKVLTTVFSMKYPHVALHTASSGRTGLELFKAHTADIVITDVYMPEMGGVQLVEKIRAIKPDTKFIVLSGDTGKETLEAFIGEGFEIDHYIVKPVSFSALFAAIEQCLGEIAQHS